MIRWIEPKDQWEKQIKKTDKVLDIGCWSGEKVKKLYKHCQIQG